MLTRKQRWRRVRVIKIYGMGMSPNDGSPYNFTPQRRRAASDSVLLEAFSFQKRLNPPPVQLQNDLTTTHPTSIRSGGASKTSTRPRARSLDTWSFPGLAILKFFIGDGGRSCVGERKFSEGEENCGTNSFGSARSRAGSESHTLQVRASRRGSSSWPRMSESKGRVRFNQQIRVVLVPSRGEMTPFKADVWWGATDYCYFRIPAPGGGYALMSTDEDRIRLIDGLMSGSSMFGITHRVVAFNQLLRPAFADCIVCTVDHLQTNKREYLLATRKQSLIEIEAARRTCSAANFEQTAEVDGDEICSSDANTGIDDESLPPPPPPPSPTSDARKSPSWFAGCAETTTKPHVSFRDTGDVAQNTRAVGREGRAELAVPARGVTAPSGNGAGGAAIGPSRGDPPSVPSLLFLPSSPPIAIQSQTSNAADRCQRLCHPDAATTEATSHANIDRLSRTVPRAIENSCVTLPCAARGTGGGCLLVDTTGSVMLEASTPVGVVERVAGMGGSVRASTTARVDAATAVPLGGSGSATTEDGARAAGAAQSMRQREERHADADLARHLEQPREGTTDMPSRMWHLCGDTLTREQMGKISERFMINKLAYTTGNVAVLAGQIGKGLDENRNEMASTQIRSTRAVNEGARNALNKSKRESESSAAGAKATGGEDKKARRNLPVSSRWQKLVEGVCAVETNGVGGVVGLGFPWRGRLSPEADSTVGLASPASSTAGVGRTCDGSPVMLRTGGWPRGLNHTPLPCLGSSPIRRVASF